MNDLFDAARDRASCCTAAAVRLLPALEGNAKISRAVLNDAMTSAYGGSNADGRWTQPESFEVLEHALALAMRVRSTKRLHVALDDVLQAAMLVDRLPTQTGVYLPYRPSRIVFDSAGEHPTALVESVAMGSIPAPIPTHVPALPELTVKDRLLLFSQLETVVYAGHAWAQFIPGRFRPDPEACRPQA